MLNDRLQWESIATCDFLQADIHKRKETQSTQAAGTMFLLLKG